MSEYRQDLLTGRWVVMAPEREARPIATTEAAQCDRQAQDPFEAGQESQTPPEVLAYREPCGQANGPGWRVRVVPNKYPALQRADASLSPWDASLHRQPGTGAHEVVIECPQPETQLARLSQAQLCLILQSYRDRLLALSEDPRLAHAIVFKNQGALAGASLAHCHSQIISTPFVTSIVAAELAGAQLYQEQHHRGYFSDLIRDEQATGTRIVCETEWFLAFCPFASRFAYETWIVPKVEGSHYERAADALLADLGTIYLRVLQALAEVMHEPPLNAYLHSAPFRTGDLPHFRWHWEIFPRITRVAGFEWASDCFINPVLPETAAAALRSAL